MVPRFMSLQAAVDLILPGDQVIVSGNMKMSPMAIVREMVRQKKEHLNLLCASAAAINVDLLIGAGMVAELEFPHVSLGGYGGAVHFRRALEQRLLSFKDCA